MGIKHVPPVITGTAVSKDETRDFMAVFPDIVRDLTDTGRNLDVPDVTKWLSKVVSQLLLLVLTLFIFYVLITSIFYFTYIVAAVQRTRR